MKKILLLLIVAVAVIVLLAHRENTPATFVKNMTFETRSDMLYSYEITIYPSSAEVLPVMPESNITIGVVVDPWNLNFGVVPAGENFATRFVNLVNLKEKPAKISLKAYGNITPFVEFSRNDFILAAKENTTVEVKFYATNAGIGRYSGEIQVVVQRPKFDFLYSFW